MIDKLGKLVRLEFTYDGGSIFFIFERLDNPPQETRLVVVHPKSPLNKRAIQPPSYVLLIGEDAKISKYHELSISDVAKLMDKLAMTETNDAISSNLRRLLGDIHSKSALLESWGRDAVEALSRKDGSISSRSIDVSSKRVRVMAVLDSDNSSWVVNSITAKLRSIGINGFDLASDSPTIAVDAIKATIVRVHELKKGQIPIGAYVIVVGPEEVLVQFSDVNGGENAGERLKELLRKNPSKVSARVLSNLPSE